MTSLIVLKSSAWVNVEHGNVATLSATAADGPLATHLQRYASRLHNPPEGQDTKTAMQLQKSPNIVQLSLL
jgi:hypothetical protein